MMIKGGYQDRVHNCRSCARDVRGQGSVSRSMVAFYTNYHSHGHCYCY